MQKKNNNYYEDEKNIHEGHRRRLMQQVYDSDFDTMPIYQQVEAFLTYIIPRCDVNPQSHRLVNKFKTFSGIIDAPFDDLAKVRGIGADSARKIVNFKKMMEKYTRSKIHDAIKLSTLGKLYDSLYMMFLNVDVEQVYLFAFNNTEECYMHKKIAEGDNAHVNLDVNKVYEFCRDYKVPQVLIVHNHPKGRCNPSNGDLGVAQTVKTVSDVMGFNIMDNLIVGVDGIFSIFAHNIIKDYANVDIDSLVNMFIYEGINPQE